ncbi:S8 family serine peptidase [Actinomadura welshii]
MKVRNSGRSLIAAVSAAAALVAAAPAAQAAPAGWEVAALKAQQAQALSQKQGEGITVAVIDTGVDDRHPDLQGKVTHGKDFARGGVERGDPRWGIHGTAMAFNVLKVAPKARILAIRGILEDEDPARKAKGKKIGGGIVPSIHHAVNQGADVISLSLGGDGTLDMGQIRSVERATGYAISKGVAVVASAGNDGRAADTNAPSFPAGIAGAIAIAATRPDGGRAEFSTVRSYVDVAAPGVGIKSAKPGGGYNIGQGTSQAGALAAGVVALMKSRNPGITPGEVRKILRETATGSSGWNPKVGYGQIDAAAAVRAAANPPETLKAPVPYEGESHLGKPAGIERTQPLPVETSLIVTAAVAALIGLALLGGGIALARRRRPAPVPAPPMGGAFPMGGAPPMGGGPPMSGAPPMGGGPPMGGAPPMGGPR